jgi:hypothetical protein
MEDENKMLAPPVLSQLRAQAAGSGMERTLSADIREEREDLREAAEQTLNVIMDLGLDGNVRWVSPSWTDVIGTTLESVQGKPIKDLLLGDNKGVFDEVVESMKKDDSRSQIIRFTVQLGPESRLLPLDELKESEAPAEQEPATIDLEGQGIMVYDRSSGGESHVRLLSHAKIIMLTLIDYVDDPTLDRTTRNSNRPACCHSRISRIGRRNPGRLSDNSRRNWFGGSRKPCTTTAGPMSHLRTPNPSLVVRKAH